MVLKDWGLDALFPGLAMAFSLESAETDFSCAACRVDEIGSGLW
jgi:hypothetical protein